MSGGEPVGIPDTPEGVAEFAKGQIHEACVAALVMCVSEDWDDAVGLIDSMIAAERGGENAGRYMLLRASALTKAGRPEEALVAVNSALDSGQRNARGWCAKAGILQSLGDHEAALACCKKAAEAAGEEERSAVLEQEAAALMALRRHADAVRVADRALELNPDSIGMRIVKASAHRAAGRHAEAVEEASAVAARWPKKTALRVTKASFLMDAGMYEEMIEEIEPLTRGMQATGAMWYNKSRALSRLGRYEESLDALTVAVSLDPQIVRVARDDKDLRPVRGEPRCRRLLG